LRPHTTVLFLLLATVVPTTARGPSLSALGEQLAESHRQYLDSRRDLLSSLSDPYQVASKARLVEELPASWDSTEHPWRRNIRATLFWVGEKATPRNPTPNDASSWDPTWQESFGGVDSPTQREGYCPHAFIPQQTPFYIALPYNDLLPGSGHKAEAAEVIPWFWKLHDGPTKSVCHGRWLALHRDGRICYAMWRDAGPFATDDWSYVFGDERPQKNPNRNAGIDVSPAVRDYLELSDDYLLDWKFVEDFEVPDGPWKNWQPPSQ
jgi:hypothetical protein